MNAITNKSEPVTTKDKIGNIVQSIPGSEALFKTYGLDCNRHKDDSLRAVCFQKKWDEEFLLQWIKDESQWINKRGNRAEKITANGTVDAYEVITQKYYAYIADRLNRIQDLFQEIQTLHGNQYTQLKTMKWYVQPFVEKLRSYMDRMQTNLFPLVKKAVAEESSDREYINTLDTTLKELKRERNELLGLSKTLEQKSQAFENPKLACTRHRILNYYLKTVCSIIKEQFDAEDEMILAPIAKKKEDYNNEFQSSTNR